MEAAAPQPSFSPWEQLRLGRRIVEHEGAALVQLGRRLDREFCRAVECIYRCRGSVIVSGMGKAGLVGQKVAATLASTDTRAHFLHPAEAVHGDLGRVCADDVVLVLSQSGKTAEIVRILPSLADFGVPIIAVTGSRESPLGRAAAVVIELGHLAEACPLGLAPTTSTAAMLAVGDALALVVSKMRGLRPQDFARFHPAGNLGQKLSRVDQIMRPLDECRVAADRLSVREVLVAVSLPGRRTGAIMLIDDAGQLVGLFTDSDLARLFEQRRDSQLDEPIRSVMTKNPVTAQTDSMLREAVDLMARRKISELPVVDRHGQPRGLIDITDVVGVFPEISLGDSPGCSGDGRQPGQSWRVIGEPDSGPAA
jgi:arabinose-5-phosphate isomerase